MMQGQLLLRMLHAAGAQLGTRAVGVGSQLPVKLDMTFRICSIPRRGEPWRWKVFLSVKETGCMALHWK